MTQTQNLGLQIREDYNLPSLIESHAERISERVAVRFLSNTQERAERTYDDLQQGMARFAHGLNEIGVEKGDRVMHLLPRHPDVFSIQLGVLRAGALVVPCSAMLKSKDLAFRANDCQASTIVAHASLLDMVDPIVDETPLENLISVGGAPGSWTAFADVVAGQPTSYNGPDLKSDDSMTINYTSGTTGQPKPVVHRHRWARCLELVNGQYWWGISSENDLSDELLWATTGTGWAKWFWSPIGVALTTGATQLIYDAEFDPVDFLEVMTEEEVTRLCAVPTQYRMWAQEDLDRYDTSLEYALSAGEPLNREPIQIFKDAFGIIPRDGYGQTETVALVTNYPGLEVKPGSMGKPTPGVGTTILDIEVESEVEPGETGEIAVPIDSPGIFDEYYEKPEPNAQTFNGEYYRTGDLASRDEDGYFFFEGRADDIIISSGYRIGPFEVEDALVRHEAVAEAAAVGSPHESRGNIVKAFIVLTEGHTASDELVEEIQEHAKSETAPYKYPREVEFVDELPKTSSGKIRRVELRKREQQ